MIRNLVIGSEGFIGKPFCKYLESLGESVERFDIKLSEKMDARTATLDLANIDRVYFLAWEVGGAKFLYQKDNEKKQMDANLKILTNTMPQLEKSGVPFLFISSQLADNCDITYGVTKRTGEVWTKLLDNGYCIRQWNVYGPIEDKDSEKSHVVSDFIHQAIENGEIHMMTNGEEERQLIHIDDVCALWHRILSEKTKEIYDVTSFEWVKIVDVANMIAKMTGAKAIPGPEKGKYQKNASLRKYPHMNTKVTLEEGLGRIIDSYKK